MRSEILHKKMVSFGDEIQNNFFFLQVWMEIGEQFRIFLDNLVICFQNSIESLGDKFVIFDQEVFGW